MSESLFFKWMDRVTRMKLVTNEEFVTRLYINNVYTKFEKNEDTIDLISTIDFSNYLEAISEKIYYGYEMILISKGFMINV